MKNNTCSICHKQYYREEVVYSINDKKIIVRFCTNCYYYIFYERYYGMFTEIMHCHFPIETYMKVLILI